MLADPNKVIAREEEELREPVADSEAAPSRPGGEEVDAAEDPSYYDSHPVTPAGSRRAEAQVDLTWENLRYTVQVKGDDGKHYGKVLLQGMSGTARRCRTLAIMGPSGAGKSTFLTAICGRLQVDKSHTLEGTAFLNDVVFHSRYKPVVSFVAQDDIVMGKDTPREALNFSYRMRSGANAAEAEVAVNEMLQKLSLGKAADTLLGVPGLIKGVSGGEKKRTNIGAELINNPLILLLDEPTTGLDSVNALRVGQLLRTLAHEDRRTVICTIHTPSSELYDVFDDILLLAKGYVIYHGPCKEAPAYFAAHGHAVPARMNPSEHFMNVLQLPSEELDVLAEAWKAYLASPESRTNLSVNRAPAHSNVRTDDHVFDRIVVHRAVGYGTQFTMLAQRSWRTVVRDPVSTIGRFVQAAFFAVLLALFYANLKSNDDGVTDRAGVLFMEVMNLTFLHVMNALATFPPERAVFLQEQSSGMYNAILYYWSKVLAETPFLLLVPTLYVIITYWSWGLAPGAVAFFNHLATAIVIAFNGNAFGLAAASVFPRPEIAMTVTPVLIMPLMLVGGLFANTERLEPYWVWLNYVSFPRYAYKALFVNEFDHQKALCPQGGCRFHSGQDVKNFYGFNKAVADTAWFNIILLLVCMAVFRVIGTYGLWLQGAMRRSRLVFETNFRKMAKSAAKGERSVDVSEEDDAQ